MADISERFDAGGWEFTPEVVEVFDQHVTSSVPHYDKIQELVAEASDWLVPHGGIVADLGSSSGTTVALITGRHPSRRIRAHLYDESEQMMTKALGKLAPFCSTERLAVETHVQRLQVPLKHHGADLTTALFTLQFLHPKDRVPVLERARLLASEGGALILAEKVRPAHPLWHEIGIDASHDVKAAHGLDDTAIRQKARSLRGVLQPRSLDQLTAELDVAGWKNVETLFRWHQWVVLGAFA